MNNKNIKLNLKREYIKAFKFIMESKKYLYLIIIIFLFFVLLGFFLPIPKEVLLKIIDYFKELITKTDGFGSFKMIIFLFKNNFLASFFGIIFGTFFGVFSIINASLNGAVLGIASSMSVAENGILSLWKIFPHGIFELPALLISLSMGLRLGFFIFTKEKLKEFNYRLKGSLRVFFLIVVPLLLIAAIIEGLLITLNR